MAQVIQPARSRVVGGVFGVEDGPIRLHASIDLPWTQPRRAVQFVNARSALYVAACTFHPRRVWLPSFLCPSIVDAFRESGVPHHFYAVDETLRCCDRAWLNGIQAGDFVVRIHYFGFVNDDPTVAEASEHGARIIDDAAQALLTSGIPANGLTVYSLRKFIGVPDGACLVAPEEVLHRLPSLGPVPTEWWCGALSAGKLRQQFDSGASRRDWFERFQHAERTAPVGSVAMSGYVAARYQHGFDYSMIAQRRRANYLTLAKSLRSVAIFPTLPDQVVPLGFPVQVSERDLLRHKLFEAGIFPPTHWPLTGIVPSRFERSHVLSGQILTLVCDQRYGVAEMMDTAAVVADHLAGYK